MIRRTSVVAKEMGRCGVSAVEATAIACFVCLYDQGPRWLGLYLPVLLARFTRRRVEAALSTSRTETPRLNGALDFHPVLSPS